jgi:hypothetical protein
MHYPSLNQYQIVYTLHKPPYLISSFLFIDSIRFYLKYMTCYKLLLSFIFLGFTFINILTLDAKKKPLNRLDLSGNYTWMSIGDWQKLNVSYTRQWDQNWNAGLATRYLRRTVNQSELSDLSFMLPIYYVRKALTLKSQIDFAPQAIISPLYSLELSTSYRFKKLPITLHSTYKYAAYNIAYSNLLLSGVHYNGKRLNIGAYAYLVFPEFGPNLLTPQLRVGWYFNYFWRLVWWTSYGYETLNERFVDPRRQSTQWTNFLQIKHLLTDWQGLNLGVAHTTFFPDNSLMAQEIFNQDRIEVSLHYFWRF